MQTFATRTAASSLAQRIHSTSHDSAQWKQIHLIGIMTL